jgi:hypothetical protein
MRFAERDSDRGMRFDLHPGYKVLERDRFQCQMVRSGKIEQQKSSNHVVFNALF